MRVLPIRKSRVLKIMSISCIAIGDRLRDPDLLTIGPKSCSIEYGRWIWRTAVSATRAFILHAAID